MRTRSHEICTGCSCCLLSCPVWRRTRDRSLTAQGRNKALQGGAVVEDIAEAIDSCILCGACEPNCHVDNDIVGLTLEQRRLLNQARADYPTWYPVGNVKSAPAIRVPYKGVTILTGDTFDKVTTEAILKHLGNGSIIADDNGSDISRLFAAGLAIAPARLDDFVYPLRSAASVVATDGLLLRFLREQLPNKTIIGLGKALLSMNSIRSSLGPDDLYVIEPRGYHSDYARLVKFYDNVHKETGVQFNLDLQRAAIPTGASSLQRNDDMCVEQAKWILQGKKVKRVIVEDAEDIEVFRRVTDMPVVHLAFVV